MATFWSGVFILLVFFCIHFSNEKKRQIFAVSDFFRLCRSLLHFSKFAFIIIPFFFLQDGRLVGFFVCGAILRGNRPFSQ